MAEIIQPERVLGIVTDTNDIQLSLGFATSDRSQVNQHFGTASMFSIYGLNDQNQWQRLSVLEFPETRHAKDSHDKLQSRIDHLASVDAVFCLAVGPSAVQRMARQQIQPIVLDQPEPIKTLLQQFVACAQKDTSSWQFKLAQRKQLHGQRKRKLSRLMEEPWDLE